MAGALHERTNHFKVPRGLLSIHRVTSTNNFVMQSRLSK